MPKGIPNPHSMRGIWRMADGSHSHPAKPAPPPRVPFPLARWDTCFIGARKAMAR